LMDTSQMRAKNISNGRMTKLKMLSEIPNVSVKSDSI
jgi:hypothetical protein